MGRIFEKRGSAESHLTHYSKTPKKERLTDTGRILNCSDEWVDVEIVASKLVDLNQDEVTTYSNEMYKRYKEQE